MIVTGNMLARTVAYAAKHYPDDESQENRIAQQSYIDGFKDGYDLMCQEWLEYARMIQRDGRWVKLHQLILAVLLGMFLRGLI